MDSIIVSRPFNIHQLAGLLIDELDPAVVKQRFGAKLIVISDLLKMFIKDSKIDPDEALLLVKEIERSPRRLSSHVSVVVSMHECPPAQYSRLLLSLFDNQIHITTTAKEPGRFQVKVKSNFDNLHDEGSSSNSMSEPSSSFVITERDLKIIPAR
jgi:hypothetical protein